MAVCLQDQNGVEIIDVNLELAGDDATDGPIDTMNANRSGSNEMNGYDKLELKDDATDESDEATRSNNSMNSNDEIEGFHYWTVLFGTLLCFSIGFIIHIFVDLEWLPIICGLIGFTISVIVTLILRTKSIDSDSDNNNIQEEHSNQNIDKQSGGEELGFSEEWKEDPDNDAIYVKTDFKKKYTENTKRKRAINYTGSTRVFHKKDCGAIMVERRAKYIFNDYQGYEIGGGTGGLVGSIVALIKIIANLIDSSTDWFFTITILILVVIILICIGCIIEIQLRKAHVVPPNTYLFTTSQSIALHEIDDIERYSIGWHHNVVSDMQNAPSLFFQKMAIKLFYAFVMFGKIFKYLFDAMWINAAFVCLIVSSILIAMLFELTINKSQSSFPDLIQVITGLSWILFFMLIFAVWFTSRCCTTCCCANGCTIGDKTFGKLGTDDRVQLGKQKLFMCVFCVCMVMVFLSSIFVSTVSNDIYDIADDDSASKIKTSSKLVDSQWCDDYDDDGNWDGNGGSSNNDNNDSDSRRLASSSDVDEPFCADGNPYLLNVSLMFLCVVWYLLLFLSFCWMKWDKYSLASEFRKGNKSKNADNMGWERIAALKFGLKKKKTKSWFMGGSNTATIIVELDEKGAKELHEYLADLLPYFKKHEFIPHQFYSKFRYNSFDNLVKDEQ